MAVVVESVSTVFVGDSQTDVRVSKPSGTVEGDLLVAGVTCDGSSNNITPPSGWTQLYELGSDHRTGVWYKIAGASEPANYTWQESSETWIAGILRISGHDASTPVDVATGTNTGSDDTPLCPSITTVTDGCLILRFEGNDAEATNAAPSGTVHWDEYSGDHGSSGECQGACISTSQSTAGATGTASFTLEASDGWSAGTVAIRPDAGVKLSPSAVSAIGAKIDPTSVLGSISKTPVASSAVGANVAPAVVLGNITFSPAALSAIAAKVDPTPVLGSLTVAPTAAAAVAAKVEPIVINNVIITPASAGAIVSGLDPSAILGNLTFAPTSASAVGITREPVPVLGGISLAPGAASALTAKLGPFVINDVIVIPAAVSARTSHLNPLALLGSVTVAPPAAASTTAKLDPGVTLGGLVLVPTAAASVAEMADPTASLGSLVLSVAPSAARTERISPDVGLGSITLSPAAVAALVGQADPGVVFGSLTLTPGAVDAIAATLDPTVDIVQFVAALIVQQIAFTAAVAAEPALKPAAGLSGATLEAALRCTERIVLDGAVASREIPLTPAVAGKAKLN